MRRLWLASLAAVALAAGCTSSPSSITVTNAAVDPTHSCPAGATDAAYSVHATANLHNPTSTAITLKSVSAEMTLEDVKGAWQEKVGSTYTADRLTFTPATLVAGGSATLNVTIPSTCTNGRPTGGTTYGDYKVTLHVDTSAGTVVATAKNLHRILAA
ncbi:MAG TPA: hypothetical protein VGG31_05170 [Candidatus Dormibacteraeota bacterium]|jgi:hypothetical protein